MYFLKLSALIQLSSCIAKQLYWILDVKIDCEATDLTNSYCYCNFYY